MEILTNNSLIKKHPRAGYLEPLIKNKSIVESLVRYTPNANTSDWRSIPNAPLSYMKTEIESSFSKIENSLVYAFSTEKIQHVSTDIIPVKNYVFWELVRDGDDLLISDRTTHHFTTVETVDTKNNLIYLSDPWPQDIFLRAGFNDSGVEARIEGNLVVITRAEYLRVVIGLLTVDDASFIDYYFESQVADKANYKIYYSFGQTLLKHGFDEYVFSSISYLQKSVNLLESASPDINKLPIVQSLVFSLELAIFISKKRQSNEEADEYQNQFLELCNQYGQESLLQYYSEVDFYRLGILVAGQNNFNAAANYFTRSVNVKEDYYKSHLYLALALQSMKYFQDAVNSSTNAINYIENEFAHLQAKLTSSHLGAFEKSNLFGELSELQDELIKALKIRGGSYHSLGKSDKSINDLSRVQQMQNKNLS